MKKTTLYITDDLHEILRERSFKEKKSFSQIISEALGYSPKIKTQFKTAQNSGYLANEFPPQPKGGK